MNGFYVRNGDLMTILEEECGTDQTISGWPREGTSDPALFGGTEFVWGVLDGIVLTSELPPRCKEPNAVRHPSCEGMALVSEFHLRCK